MDVLEGLSALVDHSLIQPREEGGEEDGEPRFGMLHVVREYALERLATVSLPSTGPSPDRPEAETLRQAHARYFLALAERAEPELTGPAAATWLARLEREHDNLRAALR